MKYNIFMKVTEMYDGSGSFWKKRRAVGDGLKARKGIRTVTNFVGGRGDRIGEGVW